MKTQYTAARIAARPTLPSHGLSRFAAQRIRVRLPREAHATGSLLTRRRELRVR